ncbi:hypothetical protein P5V15_011411 [Pogonomyrmex californicus]
MVDTGAAPNLIKKRCLRLDTSVTENDTIYLTGITDGKIETLGSAKIEFGSHEITLHVVPDSFPIAQEGILGSDFLHDDATIDFGRGFVEWRGIKLPFTRQKDLFVPARSRATFYVNVSNPEISIGYLPRLSVAEGIYLGEAIVTNRKGKAYAQIINATEADQEITIPTIRLEEIEAVASIPPREIRAVNCTTVCLDRERHRANTIESQRSEVYLG